MSVTQTVDIPPSRRLVIDVPPRVPTGRTILTFTPADEAVDEDDDAEDETERIMRNPALRERLDKAVENIRNGVHMVHFATMEDLDRHVEEYLAKRGFS